MKSNGGQHCLCGRPIPPGKIKEALFNCRLLRCTGCGLYAVASGIDEKTGLLGLEVAGFMRLIMVRGREQLFEARRISRN